TPGELNAYDVLCNDWIVFTSAVLPGAAASQESTATAPTATAPAATEPAATAPAAAEPAATEAASSTDAVAAAFAGLPESTPEATPSDTGGSAVHPHGAGSHAALRDGAQPAGFPIKGNASSNLYHLPGTAFY